MRCFAIPWLVCSLKDNGGTIKRQKHPGYRGLRQAINEARWAKSKGKKVKWAELKKTLAIARQFGYTSSSSRWD